MRIDRTVFFVVALCGFAACVHAPPLPAAVEPTPAPALRHAEHAVAVLVTSTPEVASFRVVLQRSLGQAGFEIATTPRNDVITIALVGGGAGTSGSQLAPWGGSASFASQSSIDVTLSTQGMLRDELQSQVSYSIVQHERESFDVFNKRVADAGDRAYE